MVNDKSPVVHHAEEVMGTVVSFSIYPGDASSTELNAALWQACTVLHRADVVFSTYNPTSAMSRLRHGEVELGDTPSEIREVLEICSLARAASGGSFDPWAMPDGLDPTGLVKGWAAERALAVLEDAGLQAAMVNAGGDVATFGRPEKTRPWIVGIQDPTTPSALIAAVISPGAVATSGSYERGQHVLDPSTGCPVDLIDSATVAGPSLAMADALATGLFVAGESGLQSLTAVVGFTGLIVRKDHTLAMSEGFPLLV